MAYITKPKLIDWGFAVGGTLAILGFWYLITAVFGFFKPIVLPSPVQIVESGVQLQGLLIDNLISTLEAAVTGYVISVLIALIVAIVITESELIEDALMPLLVGGNSIPKVSVAPLFIFYFGQGFGKTMVAAWIAFFPLVVNIIEGLRDVSDAKMELFETLDATTWQEYKWVRLPNALPFIFDGMKLGATLSIIGVITAEFIISDKGIGNLALVALSSYDTALALAIVCATGIVSVTVFFALFVLQSKIVHWKDSSMFTE